MRIMLLLLSGAALLTLGGCVKVDLGQASKDWSDVGKSFADGYKKTGTPPAGTPQQTP
ncbi:MAG: hypothetical protein NTZ78_07190 [Candidatus Aureabacteria bacterium]|nr:hypothetical protein [Candidatus Auribacterota bacterium]